MARRDGFGCGFGRSGRGGRGAERRDARRDERYGDCPGGPGAGRREEGGGPYRSRRGMVLGVCRGLAEHFDFPVFWVRVFTVLAILFTGLWPGLALYFIAGLFLKLEPVLPVHSPDEREFYDAYASSRAGALARIRDKFERLERRIRRMEDVVTSRDYAWEERLRQRR